jgi:hypothetical protein
MVFFLSLTAPSAALAYLDPGSGSMLLQLVLGGLAGLAVIAKLYWHRLLGLFGRHAPQEESESDMDSTSLTTSDSSDGPQ